MPKVSQIKKFFKKLSNKDSDYFYKNSISKLKNSEQFHTNCSKELMKIQSKLKEIDSLRNKIIKQKSKEHRENIVHAGPLTDKAIKLCIETKSMYENYCKNINNFINEEENRKLLLKEISNLIDSTQ